MHGLPPSMLSFSQSLGVYSPVQSLAWTMKSMLRRVQTFCGLCPSSLAPRPGTCSKHLNPHSHTLFNSSSRYSPEHFFARLSLRLLHTLYNLYDSTLISGLIHILLYLLSCTIPTGSGPGFDIWKVLQLFLLTNLVTSPYQHAFQSHLLVSIGVAGVIDRSCSSTIQCRLPLLCHVYWWLPCSRAC